MQKYIKFFITLNRKTDGNFVVGLWLFSSITITSVGSFNIWHTLHGEQFALALVGILILSFLGTLIIGSVINYLYNSHPIKYMTEVAGVIRESANEELGTDIQSNKSRVRF
jgi:hypothetical protein